MDGGGTKHSLDILTEVGRLSSTVRLGTVICCRGKPFVWVYKGCLMLPTPRSNPCCEAKEYPVATGLLCYVAA